MWFIAGSWLYFYRRYMHDGQLGVLDGVTFAIGFLAEIPSGALADKFGRKKILVVGLLLNMIGYLLHAVGGYGMIFVAQTCLTVGWAFVSGADDALVYDSLKEEKKESQWKKVIARKYQISIIFTLVSYIIGAVLYRTWFRLAFIAEGLVIIPAIFIALGLVEAKVVGADHEKSYFKKLRDGVKALLQRKNVSYLLIALVFLGVGYAFDFGSLTTFSLDHRGVHQTGQAIVLTIIGGLSVVLLFYLEKIRSVPREKHGLVIVASIMTASIFAGVLSHSVLIGVATVVVIRLCSNALLPWLNDVVQHNVSSSHRATALSSLAVLYKLPYVFIAPFAGVFSRSNRWDTFMLVIGSLMIVGLAGYLILTRSNE